MLANSCFQSSVDEQNEIEYVNFHTFLSCCQNTEVEWNSPLDLDPEPLLVFSLTKSGLGGKSSDPMPDDPCDDDVFDFF